MTGEVSDIRNEWTTWRPEPSDVQWSLCVVHSFMIVATSKGIIPLIPWSLAKKKNIKTICILLWFTIQSYVHTFIH